MVFLALKNFRSSANVVPTVFGTRPKVLIMVFLALKTFDLVPKFIITFDLVPKIIKTFDLVPKKDLI
jgi:hypothetical protein